MVKKINEAKKKEIEDIKRLISEYPVMGIVNLENLPAFQLLRIKYNLGKRVVLKVTKKSLIKIAFDETKKEDLIKLKEKLIGIPALIFTKEDPFMLAKLLNKSKSKCAAKPGQTAPNDIVIPAGATDFPAGPMIGEFGQLGIKTKVEDGKISILTDKIIVEEGQVINTKIANLLSKLKIEPMEIGLNLSLTYKDGEILTKDILFIDEQEYLDNLVKAYLDSFGLAMEIGYLSKDTIERMLGRAVLGAKSLESKVDFGKTEKATKGEAKMEEIKEEPKEEAQETEVSVPQEQVIEESKEEEEPKEEVKEEIKEEAQETEVSAPQEQVIEEPKEEEIKEEKNDKNLAEHSEDAVKKAQEILQQATDNKIAEEETEKKEVKAKVPTAQELVEKKKDKDNQSQEGNHN